MNHRTPAETFRARLAALSRPQLEEAMRYLRERDPDAMERALEFAAMDPATGRQAALHATIADLAMPDEPAVEYPAPVTVGQAYCLGFKNFPGLGTALCERLDAHSEHRAPGWREGDPDITWTDKPRVYAGDFGATIAEDGAK